METKFSEVLPDIYKLLLKNKWNISKILQLVELRKDRRDKTFWSTTKKANSTTENNSKITCYKIIGMKEKQKQQGRYVSYRSNVQSSYKTFHTLQCIIEFKTN